MNGSAAGPIYENQGPTILVQDDVCPDVLLAVGVAPCPLGLLWASWPVGQLTSVRGQLTSVRCQLP